jgi:hypothetical protein
MKPQYNLIPEINEADCMEVLTAWAGSDYQRKLALDNDLDTIVDNVKAIGGSFFGRQQAAMVLYRLIQKGYYPSKA